MSTSTHKPKVNIRLAKFSEVYSCADVIAQSFRDDVLFGQHIHPYRAKYPGHMALFFYRAMLGEYFDWSMAFVVATETHSSGKEVVIGIAQWHRYGKTARECGWGLASWDPRRLLSPILNLYSTIASRINPNRAVDPTRATILAEGDPFTAHIWELPARQDRWYLHLLGVHPDHQNKGVGRKLVAWGIEQSRKENVAASVVAAYNKDVFYQSCGFRRCIGWAGMGVGNPLGRIRGGRIWWVSPGEVVSEREKREERFWLDHEPWCVDADENGDGRSPRDVARIALKSDAPASTTITAVPVDNDTDGNSTVDGDDGSHSHNKIDGDMDAKLRYLLKVDEIRGNVGIPSA